MSKESDNRHYSEKGGHKKRGDFWKDAKKLERDRQWQQRRSMRRDPNNGK